jgi:hypothetical protein
MKTPTTIRSLLAAAFFLAATPFAAQAALQVNFPDGAECSHETAYALGHRGGWQITVNESDKLLSFPLVAGTEQNDMTQGKLLSFPLVAGTEQNDMTQGTEVGILLVRYLEGELRVIYLMHTGFGMEELHLVVGEDDLTGLASGSYTAKAENLNGASIFTHTSSETAASVNVAAHVVVQVCKE